MRLSSSLLAGASIIAAAALTACGGNTTNPAASPSAQATDAASTAAAPAGGGSKVTVNGQVLSTDRAAGSCQVEGDSTIVAIGDTQTAEHATLSSSAVITNSDKTVTLFTVIGAGGSGAPLKITFNTHVPDKPATLTATQSGDVWTVSGQATPEGGEQVPVELVVNCAK